MTEETKGSIKSFGETASKLSRNPLGIIALFIVLVYAIAALVLGVAIGHLESTQITLLVCFLVFFPAAVLYVFKQLVIEHHTKLYGPGDYRSDEGFLGFTPLNPAEKREKISQEVAQEVALAETTIEESDKEINPKTSDNKLEKPTGDFSGKEIAFRASGNLYDFKSISRRIKDIEILAIKALQMDMNLSFHRGMKLATSSGKYLYADAVANTTQGLVIAEIKRIRRHYSTLNQISLALNQLAGMSRLFTDSKQRIHRLILVIVIDGQSSATFEESINQTFNEIKHTLIMNAPIKLVIYNYSKLQERFGIKDSDVEEH